VRLIERLVDDAGLSANMRATACIIGNALEYSVITE